MKICFNTYPWALDCPGGGERQLMAYREHISRAGIDVRLFDMWDPGFEAMDIFHCFSVMPGSLEVCDYAKKRGAKLVVSPNLWVTPETKQDYPYDLIWNYFDLADVIIVNSGMELNRLSNTFDIQESKFRVVYNAAEAEFLLPENPSIFTEYYEINGLYILNIANIEPRKNQLRFLEVLKKERPDLTFVIAGGIRDEAYAEECRKVGGDRLKIVGPLPYASPMLRAAMSGCVFFAMPSLLETPSIAAIEAAAIGARVLLTNQGSTTEYFGQSVVYVSPDSDASMAAGIHAAMEANSEHSIWVARHNYLWPKVIPSVIDIYKSLLRGAH